MIAALTTDLATPDLFTNSANFDDFAAAAADQTIVCPLTQTLNQLAEQTQQKLAKATDVIMQVEINLAHPSEILRALENWKLTELEDFVNSVVKTLQEGRHISIDSEFVFQALYGPKYPEHYWQRSSTEFRLEIFGVWDPGKLIDARNRKFGNLEEAEKGELFKKVARYLARAQARDNEELSPKQLAFHFHFFREESYEKGVIRHYYNAGDYHKAFNEFQRLLGHLTTGRLLSQCSHTVPEVFNHTGPFIGSELYRWHEFSVPGISRFRFYKSGKFVVELVNAELRDRFLKALAAYTAETVETD
jgi:hypothetical protein